MFRVLLGLSLCLFAAAAFALPPTAATSEESVSAPVCPKAAKPAAAAVSDADGDGTPDKPATPAAPAHHIRGGSSDHAIAPRWHSMLPGMFR